VADTFVQDEPLAGGSRVPAVRIRLKVVPGSRMVFVGLPNAKEREDIIAYLSTLK